MAKMDGNRSTYVDSIVICDKTWRYYTDVSTKSQSKCGCLKIKTRRRQSKYLDQLIKKWWQYFSFHIYYLFWKKINKYESTKKFM